MMMEGDDDDHDDTKSTAAAAAEEPEESSWEIFRKKYPLIEDHVDFIKRTYRELNNKLKVKGKTKTPQRFNACLYSEFCDEGDAFDFPLPMQERLRSFLAVAVAVAMFVFASFSTRGRLAVTAFPLATTASTRSASAAARTFGTFGNGGASSFHQNIGAWDTITPQKLSARLYSEFSDVGNDELENQVLQNPQIAEDALKILNGGNLTGDDEATQADFRQDMKTADGSSSTIPSGNDFEDQNAKIRKAVDKYITDLANNLGKNKDSINGIVFPLLDILEEDEFWKQEKKLQRKEIEVTTKNFIRFNLKIAVKPSVFSRSLDSLMDELRLIKGGSTDSRMVPVDYFIADSDLEYKFDLDRFVEKIQYVAKEWILTKDMPEENEKEMYIAPYFCFIQSSGMGKTKLMYEFAHLTRKTTSDAHQDKKNVCNDISCDLILSSGGIVVPNGNVFDLKLDLRTFERQESNQDATTTANKIYDHLENELVKNRSTTRPMKQIHVFLFDEAQVLLEKHYGFEAFLFRCIRTWLRTKRDGITTIGVFSGTSSAILNYSIETDLLKDNELQKVAPSRDLKDKTDFYSRGLRTFEPFFTLTTIAVLKQAEEIENQSDYDKSIRYGRPLFAIMHEKGILEEKIETILRRLLLDTGKEGFDWTEHTESWLTVSVLATRVQMGSTNLSVVSKLVARGYAYLTGVTSRSATFVYMPDPVCARLAMCMMDENWSLDSLKGKDKKWWCANVKTLYSTGLCLPDKGDVGEVLTVLYFLFCCDECRRSIVGNSDYRKFSVPLGDWVFDLVNIKLFAFACTKALEALPRVVYLLDLVNFKLFTFVCTRSTTYVI
jgi:hypothetical protein